MFALCAQDLFPDDAKVYLGFTNCIISTYKDIPSRSLLEQCALEHGINFDKLNNCASDNGYAEELLRASVIRGEEAGVTRSCTVRVDEEQWCVFDNGQWKGCKTDSSVESLVDEIKDRHSKRQ